MDGDELSGRRRENGLARGTIIGRHRDKDAILEICRFGRTHVDKERGGHDRTPHRHRTSSARIPDAVNGIACAGSLTIRKTSDDSGRQTTDPEECQVTGRILGNDDGHELLLDAVEALDCDRDGLACGTSYDMLVGQDETILGDDNAGTLSMRGDVDTDRSEGIGVVSSQRKRGRRLNERL